MDTVQRPPDAKSLLSKELTAFTELASYGRLYTGGKVQHH